MPRTLLVPFLLLITGCTAEPSEREVHEPAEHSAPRAVDSPAATLRFNPMVVSPGERLGSFTVREVQVSPSIVDGEPVGWVRFAGEVELSGRIAPHPEGGTDLCFFPDRESAALLPRMQHDTRPVWLCFADPARAREALGFEQGHAVLVIDEYRTVAERNDAADSGRLARVIEAAPLPEEEGRLD